MVDLFPQNWFQLHIAIRQPNVWVALVVYILSPKSWMPNLLRTRNRMVVKQSLHQSGADYHEDVVFSLILGFQRGTTSVLGRDSTRSDVSHAGWRIWAIKWFSKWPTHLNFSWLGRCVFSNKIEHLEAFRCLHLPMTVLDAMLRMPVGAFKL